MTRRLLWLLVLVTTAACGSGRIVPADTPEPSSAPANPQPVAEPAPDPRTQPPPPAPGPEPAAAGYAPYDSLGSIAIRRVGQWSTSAITAPARLVIRDDTAYARLWSALGDAGSRPSVDFTRDLVIVAASGQQTAGGHSIEIERVTRVGAGLAIQVVETLPGPGCPTTQALTQPVDVVVVEAADARTWSFSDRRVTGGC